MSGRLEGKVAVITGGVSGMGLATVRRFLAEGAKVVMADIQDEPGRRLEAELGGLGDVLFQHCDVGREDDVAAAVQRAVDRFGGIDCMFNNAGFGGVGGELDALELGDAYDRTVAVLFTGVLAGVKHAFAAMKVRGSGSIINTASVAGLRGGFGGHVYSSMKAAVVNLTRSAALELGPYGVRINAICPGFIATPIFAGRRNMNYEQRMAFSAEVEKLESVATPIRRAGKGSDIAAMAVFLASDESEFVTGQQMVVDGGLTAGRRREAGSYNRFQEIAERIEADHD